MIDVVYLYPPAGRQKKFEQSIGIGYIQAYIKQFGYISKQLQPSLLNVEDIVNQIIELNPKVVSFTCYDTNYYYVRLLSSEIKRVNKNIIIIVGGPTATFNSKLIMEDCLGVDYCIKGYGEVSTLKLLDFIIKKQGTLLKVEGLVYKSENNIYENDIIQLPNNIDFLPSPYLSDIQFEPDRKIVFTSRGCIYNCVYCNCSAMSNKKIFYHSVDRVIEELKYLSEKYPDEYVLIGDDAFSLNIDRAKIICKKVIENNIKLKLFCETRADKIDDELIELLKKAGFIKIDFGLETASPKVLRNIKKIFTNTLDTEYQEEKNFIDSVNKAVQKVKAIGIEPMVNIITGLPGENIDDANNTVNYINQMDIKSYSHNYLRIYSGTELFKLSKKWGYKIRQDAFWLPYIIEYPYEVTKVKGLNNCIIRNEIVNLKKKIINILENDQTIYTMDLLQKYNDVLRKIELNAEIFIKIQTIQEIDTVNDFIVKSNIPTTNINYLLEDDKSIICFNNGDRQNYVQLTRVKDMHFKMPTKYYEMLYIEKINDDIINRCKEINVNPYFNKFIKIKEYKVLENEENFKQYVIEYCKTYKKEKYENLLKRFIEDIKYDSENITTENMKVWFENSKINSMEIKEIILFLRYYIIGVVDDEG